MYNKTIILRYGEIYLKGKNQKLFKKTLTNNIKKCLKDYDCSLEILWSRYILKCNDKDLDEIIEKLKFVFGLVSLSVAVEVDAKRTTIENYFSKIKTNAKTFRVTVIRADKSFPIKSIEFEKILGGYVLENNPNLKVKLKNPEQEIRVEIRDNFKAYIYDSEVTLAGGLPLGTSGRGLLLLSGGIDSPVAGYLTAKRGMYFQALHFHSYPYTSEQAKQKVITLAKKINKFCPSLKVNFVSITKIQEEIHKNCSPEYMITLMRRFMFRIAEIIAKRKRLQAIITGENLGQVASQTVESMTSTQDVLKQIITLQPCISMDKTEIIAVSEKIGTYETSILPYEDCCTVFLPKNPIIKPRLENVRREESKLDIDRLVEESIATLETIDCF